MTNTRTNSTQNSLIHTPDINDLNSDGMTPLAFACYNGDLDIVKFLLKRNAKIDIANAKGKTPLFLAAENGHADVVELLLTHGATSNIEVASNDDPNILLTPLHTAVRNGHLEVVKILLNNLSPMTTHPSDEKDYKFGKFFRLAAEFGHLAIIQYFVDRRELFLQSALNHRAALHGASLNGHIEIVKFLIQNLDNFSVSSTNCLDALTVAIHIGHAEIVKYILETYPDLIEEPTRIFIEPIHAQLTPLAVATHYGKIDIVKYLLEKKAKVSDPTFDIPPIFLASKGGQTSIVLSLLKENANPFSEQYTASEEIFRAIAKETGRAEVIDQMGSYIAIKKQIIGITKNKDTRITLSSMEIAEIFQRKDILNIFYNRLKSIVKLSLTSAQVKIKLDHYINITEHQINQNILDLSTEDHQTFLGKNTPEQLVYGILNHKITSGKFQKLSIGVALALLRQWDLFSELYNQNSDVELSLNQIIMPSSGEFPTSRHYTLIQLMLLDRQFDLANKILDRHENVVIDINCEYSFSVNHNKTQLRISNLNLLLYLTYNKQYQLIRKLLRRLPKNFYNDKKYNEKMVFDLLHHPAYTGQLCSTIDLLAEDKQADLLKIIFPKTTDLITKQKIVLSLITIDGNSAWHKQAEAIIKKIISFNDKNNNDIFINFDQTVRDFYNFVLKCENKNLFIYLVDVVFCFLRIDGIKLASPLKHDITLLYAFCCLPIEERERKIKWFLDAHSYKRYFDGTTKAHFEAVLGISPIESLLSSLDNRDYMGFAPIHYAILFSKSALNLPKAAYDIDLLFYNSGKKQAKSNQFLSLLLQNNQFEKFKTIIDCNEKNTIHLDSEIHLFRYDLSVSLFCFLACNNKFDLINALLDSLSKPNIQLNEKTFQPVNNQASDPLVTNPIIKDDSTLFEKLIIENQLELLKKILNHDKRQKIYFYDKEEINNNFINFSNVMLSLLEKREFALFNEIINRNNSIKEKYDICLKATIGDNNYFVIFKNDEDYLNTVFKPEGNEIFKKSEICKLMFVKKTHKLKNKMDFSEFLSIIQPNSNNSTEPQAKPEKPSKINKSTDKSVTEKQPTSLPKTPLEQKTALENSLQAIFEKYKNNNNNENNNNIFTLTSEGNDFLITFKTSSDNIKLFSQIFNDFLKNNIKKSGPQQLKGGKESTYQLKGKFTTLLTLFSNQKLIAKLNPAQNENKTPKDESSQDNSRINELTDQLTDKEQNSWDEGLKKLFCYAKEITIEWHADEQQFKIILPPENATLTIRHPKAVHGQFERLLMPDSFYEYIVSRLDTYKINDDIGIATAGFDPEQRLIRIKPRYLTTEWALKIYNDITIHIEKGIKNKTITPVASTPSPLHSPELQSENVLKSTEKSEVVDIKQIEKQIKNLFQQILLRSEFSKQEFKFLVDLKKGKSHSEKYKWSYDLRGVPYLGQIPSVTFFNLLSDAIQLLNDANVKWLSVHQIDHSIKLIINMNTTSIDSLLSLPLLSNAQEWFSVQTDRLSNENKSRSIPKDYAPIPLGKMEEENSNVNDVSTDKFIHFKFTDNELNNLKYHIKQLEITPKKYENPLYFYAYLLHLQFIFIHLAKASHHRDMQDLLQDLRHIIRHAYSKLEWQTLQNNMMPFINELSIAIKKSKRNESLLFSFQTPLVQMNTAVIDDLIAIRTPFKKELDGKLLGKTTFSHQENLQHAKTYQILLEEILKIEQVDETFKRDALLMIYSLLGEASKDNKLAVELYREIGHPKDLESDFNNFTTPLYYLIAPKLGNMSANYK